MAPQVSADNVDTDNQLCEVIETRVDAEPLLISSISSSYDVEMFRFTVADGQRLGFDIDRTNRDGGFDSYLRLFDAIGRLLAENDDSIGSNPV